MALRLVGERDAAEHARATAGPAPELDLPAELERPLAHGVPPHAGPGIFGVEAAPVVADLRAQRVPLHAELHPGVPGPRVAADVRERLLDDAHELAPAPLGQARRHALPDHELDLVGP